MEEVCRNCQHFESKDIANNGNIWGLCMKFASRGKAGVFRWGHSGCVDFKAIKETVEHQKTKK